MTEAIKYDTGKARWELLPFDALEEVVWILTMGAEKYGDRNWEKGFNWTRIVGSLFRHLQHWICGQSVDSESGRSHLAHAACNLLFLLAFEKRNVGTDDRAKTTQA